MKFEELFQLWKKTETAALAAEETAVLTIAQLADPFTHEMLAKASKLRTEADRLFQELLARSRSAR